VDADVDAGMAQDGVRVRARREDEAGEALSGAQRVRATPPPLRLHPPPPLPPRYTAVRHHPANTRTVRTSLRCPSRAPRQTSSRAGTSQTYLVPVPRSAYRCALFDIYTCASESAHRCAGRSTPLAIGPVASTPYVGVCSWGRLDLLDPDEGRRLTECEEDGFGRGKWSEG
jgi:hypothetical protein